MKEKLVDKTYKNCLYYNSGRGIPCCDYILIKKHSRGCPAGKGCTKKEIATDEKRLELRKELFSIAL